MTSNPHQPPLLNSKSSLHLLWQKLTDPDNAIEEVGLRHQARLLSALLLVALVTAVSGTIVAIMLSTPIIAIILGTVSLGLGMNYGLSRTKYYHVSVGLSIGLLTIAPFVLTAVLIEYANETALSQLKWLILSIILGSLYLSAKRMIILITVIFVTILWATLIVYNIPLAFIADTLVFFLSTSTLIFGTVHYRNLIARKRQTLLESSAHKQIEINQALQQEISNRQQSEKTLRQQSKQLESLHQIGLELTGEYDLDTLLQSIVTKVTVLLNAKRNGFWLCQPEHKSLRLAATSNINQPAVGTIIKYGEGLAGKIAESGQPLIIDDYLAWEGNLSTFAQTAGHAASAGVPVYIGKEIQGVLSITAQPDYQFTQADIQLLTLFAAQASVAIQNAQLHDETQQYTVQLEQEIIERKQIEEALRIREREMQLFLEKLQALHEVGIELTRIDSFDDLCLQAVELGREKLGFDRLGLLLYDKDTNMMLGTFGTDDQGDIRDERYFRQEVDRPQILEVLNSQSRLGFWEQTELLDKHQPIGRGWNAMGVLWDGHEGIGWLSADNFIKKEPPHTYMLEILTLYGATLGHLVARHRVEEALQQEKEEVRQFQEKLQILHEITITLSRTKTLDELYHQAIELGRNQLGYDRLGLLLYDKDANIMVGTYGTDDQGEIRDERDFRGELYPPEIVDILAGQKRLGFWQEASIRDMGQPIGQGWNAMAVLWDGHQGIGWLATDNFLKKEPPLTYMLELITLYGATLGHLVTRKRAEEMLQKRAQHLALLNDITHTTLQASNFSSMLQTLADRLGELIDADNCFITLWDDDLKKTIPMAGYELGDDTKPNVKLEPGERTMTESVLEAGRPLVAEDVYHSPYLSPKIAAQFATRSLLGLPLIAGNQKLGVALISFNEPHSFTEDEIRRGEQAAGQISLALAQAQLQEQLHEYTIDLEQKNQELRDFNHVVSHDLQAPLRTITAFGDRVLHKYADVLDPRGYDYLERSVNAASRMQILIQNLLTLSRVNSKAQQFTDVDLNQVIQDVLSDLEAQIVESGATIDTENLPTISADEIQMRQLFQNLIGNALKFQRTDIAPHVQIRVEEERAKWCKILVKDNGIGFDEKYAEQIFDMFQRLHTGKTYAGTGAGLAICRRIVTRHSGEITAVSQPNQGATFIIRLPLSDSH